jgi:hypothetical protein
MLLPLCGISMTGLGMSTVSRCALFEQARLEAANDIAPVARMALGAPRLRDVGAASSPRVQLSIAVGTPLPRVFVCAAILKKEIP